MAPAPPLVHPRLLPLIDDPASPSGPGRVELREAAARVVVQHLDPAHVSAFVDLAQRGGPLLVVEVTDAMTVAAGTVHVIPPNREMEVFDGALLPTVPGVPRGQRTRGAVAGHTACNSTWRSTRSCRATGGRWHACPGRGDDMGKDDVIDPDGGEEVEIYRKLRAFTGRYVAHATARPTRTTP